MDLVPGQVQLLHRRIDDPDIGLVADELADIILREVRLLQGDAVHSGAMADERGHGGGGEGGGG